MLRPRCFMKSHTPVSRRTLFLIWRQDSDGAQGPAKPESPMCFTHGLTLYYTVCMLRKQSHIPSVNITRIYIYCVGRAMYEDMPSWRPLRFMFTLSGVGVFPTLSLFFDSFTLISIRSPMSAQNGMRCWITRKVAGQHSAFKLILSCCTSTMLLSVTSVVIFNITIIGCFGQIMRPESHFFSLSLDDSKEIIEDTFST